MAMIGMNYFAIDPNDGTHFVHCGDDYTSIDVSGDPSGNTPGAVVQTSPGANLAGSHYESHAACFDPASNVYVGLNFAYGKNSGGAVMWRKKGDTSYTYYDTGYSAALVPPPGDSTKANALIGLFAGLDGSTKYIVAVSQGADVWRAVPGSGGATQPWSWTPLTTGIGTQGAVGQCCPIVAGNGPGYLYCFDRMQGIYRSSSYGQTWTQIYAVTTPDSRTGWLAPNPAVNGEIWFSTLGGLYKMTGAGGSSVSVTPIGGVFSAGAAGITFAPSGALYAIALPGAAPAPAVTTLYVSTDDGQSWTDWCGGDGSLGSYGPPAGKLGISSSGWLWGASGEHFGYYDHITS
jgi:hypothetical protein